MSWVGVITDAGKAAMEQAIAQGVALNVNTVKTGTGTVPEANMRAATALQSETDTGIIRAKKATSGGVNIRISVEPGESAYTMKEVGVFGVVGSGSTSVMIALYQNTDGIAVPAAESFPDFLYTLNAVWNVANDEDLEVTVDPTAFATITDTELLTTLSRGRASGSTVGAGSFAFGSNVEASGYFSHAEGVYTHATGMYSHAEGVSSTASGECSHVEGGANQASGDRSHAEGQGTKAIGQYSHAEGNSTTAYGANSSSTGRDTEAGGYASHAQGEKTHAYGSRSTAMGYKTRICSEYGLVFGRNNVPELDATTWEANHHYYVGDIVWNKDTNPNFKKCTVENTDAEYDPTHWSDAPGFGKVYEIVGGGNDSQNANLRKLDAFGNEYIKGNINFGCNDDSTGGYRVAGAVYNAAVESGGGMVHIDKPDMKYLLISASEDADAAGMWFIYVLTNGSYLIVPVIPATKLRISGSSSVLTVNNDSMTSQARVCSIIISA